MAVMFLFYADTERAAWSILHNTHLPEFTNVRHKVARGIRTNKPNSWIARLYILHPINKYIIECLTAEFTAAYNANLSIGDDPLTSRYVGCYHMTTQALEWRHNCIFMLLDDEREEIRKLVDRYEFVDNDWLPLPLPLPLHSAFRPYRGSSHV